MSKTERTTFRKEAIFWLGILGVNLIFYNNCSEQQFRFKPTEEALRSELNTGGIIIEGVNVEFTRSRDVRLLLFSNPDTDMYVTDDPKCATGGQWEKYHDIKNWELARANQEVSVYVKFRDADGVTSDCLSDSIIHDSVPPTLVYKEAPPSVTSVAAASFKLQAFDNLSKVERILCAEQKDGPYVECPASFTRSATSSGSYAQYAKAQDRAGNESEPFPYHWIFDNERPTVQLVQQPSPLTAQTSAIFQFTGQDNLTNIAKYLCAVGDTPLADCAGGFLNLNGLAEGTYTGKFQVVDGAGNASDVLNYTWTIDRTGPSVQITNGPTAFSNSKNAQLTFVGTPSSAARPITEYRCSLNNSTPVVCSSPHQYSNLADGQYTFAITAKDSEGLEATASATWTVDTVAPSLTLVDKPARYTNSRRADFKFTASDAGGIQSQTCTIDGAAVSCPFDTASAADLPQGDHKFVVTVTDRAGNSTTAEYQWTVDLTPPTVTITSGPDALTNLTYGDITFVGSDNIGMDNTGYMCRINPDTTFKPCTSPATFGSLTEGKQIVEVTGRDLAGNTSLPARYEWTVDVSGPVIVFTKQPFDHDDTQPASISFNVTDDPAGVRTPVQCTLNGMTSVCNTTTNLNLTGLSQGPQMFTVRAEDNLGNVSTASVEWKVFSSLEKKTQTIPVKFSDKVDILFVVDNSGSMSSIQDKLRTRIQGFISQLSGLNWQIALTTTDPNKNTKFSGSNVPWGDGQLRPIVNGSSPYFLNPTHSNPQSLLGDAITVGASGSSNERGINANYRFLTRATGSENPEYRSFIRTDAALTTILISDEDECSTGCSTSSSYASSVPENLINLVKTKFGESKVFVFNAIIMKPGEAKCTTGNVGNTYMRLQQLTQGLLGSVCDTDYATHLKDLGSKVASLVRSVQLECAPVDTTGDGLPDVKVTLEGGGSVPSYSVTDKLVTFSSPLPTGRHLFEYSCKK